MCGATGIRDSPAIPIPVNSLYDKEVGHELSNEAKQIVVIPTKDIILHAKGGFCE
jgi:hypothetical protein